MTSLATSMVFAILLITSRLPLVTGQLHNKKICEHLEVFSVDRGGYVLDQNCVGKPIKNESIPCRSNFDIAKINNKPFSTTYFLGKFNFDGDMKIENDGNRLNTTK